MTRASKLRAADLVSWVCVKDGQGRSEHRLVMRDATFATIGFVPKSFRDSDKLHLFIFRRPGHGELIKMYPPGSIAVAKTSAEYYALKIVREMERRLIKMLAKPLQRTKL